ncbi:MAG: DEAD/DEAH box helicase [Rhodobiaceae bacterium]|nr:DEAD/DEAH box helicase [Rhodobiaceae bacterium]MCC0053794.1 DEAD/DEAH box helicase [Rhodobiaceae bacterium]
MKNFDSLGLAESLLRAVAHEGYTTPTPIQAEVIPAMLAGKDIVGIAQTGTGKTAAFVLPLLNAIGARSVAVKPKTAGALILVPTRELAAQVHDSIRAYARFMKVSTAVVVGGVKAGPQVRALSSGVDVLIATPGRLEDLMSSGAVRLDATATVILDEADQMLDLGFMPAIRRIMGKLPGKRQTVLLSATMPAQIRSLAGDFLNDPAEIAVAPVSRPIERIDQSVIHVPSAEKRNALVGLVSGQDVERAIVFTRTKRGADRVNMHLQKAGLSAAAIHGNKSQNQREKALGAFRLGKVTILVATDIAARGIDVDDVSHVFNYELPNVPEAYVHRIGRTARAGKSGTAVSLCDPSERTLLRDIERLIGRSLGSTGDMPAETGAAARPKGAAAQTEPARKAGRKRRRTRTKNNGVAAPVATPLARSKQAPRSGGDTSGLARMLGNIATPQIA